MARPLSSEAREAMVRGALDIIGTDGVGACTVEEVARRTGIARTTIYRHFGSVDELVLAAVDSMVQATEAPDTGSLRGDLEVIMRRYLRVADNPRMRELYGWMMWRSTQDPQFSARFRAVRVQPQGVTVVALQRAIARGEVPPTIDIPLAMHLIQGPTMSKRIVEGEVLTDAEFDRLLDWTVAALTTAPG